MKANESIIAKAFAAYAQPLRMYILKRINNSDEAEDLVQDVFERLMGYEQIADETLKNLCFTIANNIIIDHIRRHYKRQEVYDNASDMMPKSDTLTPVQIVLFHDLEAMERMIMKELTPSTARVYEMTQIEEKTIDEIAKELSISRRTVECHQFRGRKYMREHLKRII